MTKTSTIHFTINNLASKSGRELINIDTLFNFQNEFEDVYEMLNRLELDVRQQVVNKLLKFASQID
ncbi:hypothetical protein ES708_05787 [subsurface metagenome]